MPDMGLDEQQAMNRQTWSALQEAGVTQGQSLDVDAFFYASSEAVAGDVEADLVAEGWTTKVDASKTGFFRRRVVWAIVASRAVADSGPDAFDDMVVRLDAVAEKHGAEFDGWGAQVD